MTSSQNAVRTRAPAPPTSGAAAPLHVRLASGWTPAVWLLLVVLCGALFLDGLDISMVGVALPSIGSDLHLSASSLQWIVSGYVLGYGGLLLLGGRASDLLGRRKVFLVAVAVFGIASVVSAFLSNDIALIALRFVKGAAAAFTVPAGLSIITTTFAEGPARSKALGIYTVCGASGFSLGLVFGGLLTEIGWRITFLVPGPVAIALLIAGLRVIPRSTREKVSLAHFDLVGAATSTLSLLTLVYTVVEAPSRGWGSAATIGGFVLSAALMAIFVWTENRHAHPLVRLGILRSGSLVHANLSGAALFGSYVSFQFIATIYLQNSLGWSPIEMALGFLPGGLIVVASAFRIGAVLERVPTPRMIMGGLSSMLIGFLLFLRVEPGMNYANFLLPTMIGIGVGFALCFPAVNAQATMGVADHEQGLASGLVNTSIQIGGAVTLAIVTAVLGSSGSAVATPGELLPGMRAAIAVVVGVAALGAVGAAFRLRYLARTAPAPIPADEVFVQDWERDAA
jgi:MFS family permease